MVVMAVFLLLLVPQTATSSRHPIHGSVRDQTGAVLPGARVEIRDQRDLVVRATTTGANGEYVLPEVPPGDYVLHVEFDGFRPSSVSVRLAGRQAPPAQNVVLELAAQAQEVTVNVGNDVLAATANGNRDAIALDDKVLRSIPMFDRDVVGTLSRFLDASALGTGGVTLVVDGMESRKVGVAPSAIQQIKVNQDPYAAEFPRPGRGRIEVITKAGSDKYSGSFDLTFRDAHINAREPFAETRPPEQRRIYEGVLGGPVGDGKHTSFLLTVDRREEDLQSIVFAAGPSGRINGARVAARPRHRSVRIDQPPEGTAAYAVVAVHERSAAAPGIRGSGEQRSPNQARTTAGTKTQVVLGARSVLTGRLLNEFRLLVGDEGSDRGQPAFRSVASSFSTRSPPEGRRPISARRKITSTSPSR